jgi:putative ABC transport system permease protein
MAPAPPRLARTLLRWALPPDDFEVISGDLEEALDAMASSRLGAPRLWYWRQVASIVCSRVRAATFGPGDLQPTGVMMAFRQDLAYALRSLRKQPGFAAMAVVMLAVGIGANVAIFALANAVLLKPLPFTDPTRLMIVHMLAPDRETPGVSGQVVWSYPKYRAFRENQKVFESTALFSSANWNLTGSESPERVVGELVESSYFQVLGVGPHAGRTFSADETQAPGSAPLAVLGYGFWIRRFGGDRNLFGRTVGLNGVLHTIVGVLPPGFRGLTGVSDVWVPLMTLRASDLEEAWNHSYTLVARRRGDVAPEQAQAAVRVLGEQIDAQYRDPEGSGDHWGAIAVALNDQRSDPLTRQSVLLMLSAVASVLLIVCLNLANLMLVRGLGRQREVAIRLALGATRLRIVRQLMTENLLLAVLGAALGLAVAYGVIAAGARVMPDLRMVLIGESAGLTRVGLGMLGLDGSTLIFTVLISTGSAVFFGLGPAWGAARRDLGATMKTGGSGSVSAGAHGLTLRSLLIVGEMALAFVLLCAGGLMIKSVARLQATELGFKPDSLLTFRATLPSPQYDRPRAMQFFDHLLGRLTSRAGIESVAYGSCAPLSGGCNGTLALFPGRPPAAVGSEPFVGVTWVSSRYFETLGIRLVRGRVFSDRDRIGQPKVVVINESAARAFWSGQDPIGKRIGVGQGGFQDGAEVVGVVADVRYGAVERSVTRDVYLPLLQSPRTMGLIFVRSRVSTASLVPALRQEVRALDPDLPLVDIKTMNERFGDATWRTRVSAWLLGVFATPALVLAALGLYAVMSHGVEQRRREIGVRMALGAGRRDIMKLIIGRVVGIATAGIVLGIVLAVPSMRLLIALLYQVRPDDPEVLAMLSLALLSVAVLAGYVPARRATRLDPLATLRSE